MKKFWAVPLVLAAALTVSFSAPAETAVTVAIRNNRSHNMSFAFRWTGFDDDNRSGWYTVKAGETRTIMFKDVVYVFTSPDFGYYATGGGRVWPGSANDERPLAFQRYRQREGARSERVF
ncbi:MAG: hypothetical protein LBS00_11245 [Synergistaceae bacterium]|jgi:uncharacterized membrane protein|nr:hypothetical protein [Synergistaceae bacterium]